MDVLNTTVWLCVSARGHKNELGSKPSPREKTNHPLRVWGHLTVYSEGILMEIPMLVATDTQKGECVTHSIEEM